MSNSCLRRKTNLKWRHSESRTNLLIGFKAAHVQIVQLDRHYDNWTPETIITHSKHFILKSWTRKLLDRKKHAWQIQIKSLEMQSACLGSPGNWLFRPCLRTQGMHNNIRCLYTDINTALVPRKKAQFWALFEKHNPDRQVELLTSVLPGMWQGEAVRNKQQESSYETKRFQLHWTLSQHSSVSLWRCDHMITASLQRCSCN